MREILMITLHHTGGANFGPINGSEVRDMVKRMAATRFAKWYPTEYHYLIAKDGTVWNDATDDTVLPHCGLDYAEGKYNNQNSIAVSVIGDYEKEIMPEAQYKKLVEVCKNLKKKYPKAIFKLHKELISTDCPGYKYNYQKLFADVLKKGDIMTFKDIDPKRWSYPAIKKCYELGLIKGDNPEEFRPFDSLTREELCQVIYNLLKLLGKA